MEDLSFKLKVVSDQGMSDFNKVLGHFKIFWEEVNKLCPNSREKSLCYTKLQEALFWASNSIIEKKSNDKKKKETNNK